MMVLDGLYDAITDHSALYYGVNLDALFSDFFFKFSKFFAGRLLSDQCFRCPGRKCVSHWVNYMHNDQRRTVQARNRLSVAKGGRGGGTQFRGDDNGPEF